ARIGANGPPDPSTSRAVRSRQSPAEISEIHFPFYFNDLDCASQSAEIGRNCSNSIRGGHADPCATFERDGVRWACGEQDMQRAWQISGRHCWNLHVGRLTG